VTPQRDVDKWVKQYIALRDQLKVLNDAHETKTAAYKELMADRAGKLQAFLDDSGVESAKTANGTVYSTTRYTASLRDANAFMDFVRKNELWDLLDKRANANAVRDYIADTKTEPPGVNLSALKTVGVRRPSGG